MRRLILLLVILFIFVGVWGTLSQYSSQFLSALHVPGVQPTQSVKVVSEENVTINDVKNVGPSVVTVVEQAQASQGQVPLGFNFGPFSIFGLQPNQTIPTPDQNQPQSIGSGFVVSSTGMIVTNKHVVSDTSGTYQIITADNKKYDVKQIYRDPLNDIALLKIDPSQNAGESLKQVAFGDSSHLQVGSYVVAIGTALGEFKNTVTTGVISGLGRGITAGDQFAGYVEQLDNVIQTSAPINPGNSGGPLVNSSGQVIGITTAVAQNGQNIGFALPISVVQNSLTTFNQTGGFVNRAYLGVQYKTISQDVALLNDVPQGAYVESVVSNSPADKAGVQQGDIIVSFDGNRVGTGSNELSSLIGKKRANDTVAITLWRNNATQNMQVTLGTSPNQ